MNWKTFLMPLIAMLFSSIGWLSKDMHLNGVSGATEPLMVGGMTVSGVWMLFLAMAQNYKKAGGRLDGKLTEQEITAIGKTLTDKVAPFLSPYVDDVAKLAAPTINNAIPPSAVELIGSLSHWFEDPQPDQNESTLNHKLLDILSRAVKGDDEGEKAAATLRARLHEAAQNVVPTISVK